MSHNAPRKLSDETNADVTKRLFPMLQLATLMTEFDVSFKREKMEDLVKGTRSVLEDAEALAKPAC